jgi:ribosome biogenesis protein ERB1
MGVAVTSIAWHGAGDYLVSTARAAPGARSVAVHRLSTAATQHPLRRVKAPPASAVFHPTRPALLVGTGANVRVYDLARMALEKKLLGGAGAALAIAPHPRGDHVVVAGEGGAAAWYDLDLGARPHRVLRYHRAAVRGAAFHPALPLLATVGDDGAAHVLHGTVYSDLATPPLLVPLRVLPGHGVTRAEGALAVAWHPGAPWLYTAGGDGCVCMWVD